MNWFNLYLITRLDGVDCLLGTVLEVSVVICAISVISFFVSLNDAFIEDKTRIFFKKTIKYSLSPIVASSLLMSFIPTTKEMAAIIIAPKVVNNEIIQEETKELYGYAKEYIKDLVSDKE